MPMESKEKYFPERGIYFVDSSEDDTVLIAIDPRYTPENNAVQWFDTVKARLKKVANFMEVSPEKIIFQDEDGAIYNFESMNLEIFNEKVKDQIRGAKDYKTQEEMEEALRKSYEDRMSY